MRILVVVCITILSACGPIPRGSQHDEPSPFDAPERTWTYVPIEDSMCANGKPMGIAVNVEPGAKELVLYLQGGGACWESFACVDFDEGRGAASHLRNGVDSTIVLNEAKVPQFYFDRSKTDNPLKNAHYVYVPYCTGDLHAGNKAKKYDKFLSPQVTVQHRGAHNLEKILERLVEEMPSLERIRFVGVSAGGYGVTLNWWRVIRAFPDAQVDVLNDSGPPISTSGGEYGTMQAAWGIEMPPGCDDCKASMKNFLPFYADSVPAPHRYGLLAYSRDEVVRLYFGYAQDPDGYESRVNSLVSEMGDRQRAFRITGTTHVMLGQPSPPSTSTNVSLRDWIEELVTDSPSWGHAGP